MKGIKQFFVGVDGDDMLKLDTYCDLYETLPNIVQAVIFASRRSTVEDIARELQRREFTVSFIHGGMEMSEREKVLNEFRVGASRVLIATDLLARGIDVQQVNLVVNFDLPSDRENYIHRIGRCARFGRKGTAINILSPRDVTFMRDIERHYSVVIKPLPQDVSDVMD